MSATPAQIVEVKAKTVAQLRTLLSDANLPTAGLKPELVDRVISNAHILSPKTSTEAPNVPAPPTNPVQAAAVAPAPTVAATEEAKTDKVVPTEDAAAIELKKREERAKRFGASDKDKEDQSKLLSRAKRFGGSVASPGDPVGVKGLLKLDEALGSGKKGKGEGKAQGGPTKPASGSVTEKPAPAAASKAAKDPAIVAADEAAKKRRLEKWGPVEQASPKPKKVKV